MAEQEPKDLRIARRAYEAFWDEQPQIWFDQLAHIYQMRWVRAARAALQECIKDVPKDKSPSPTRRRDPNPITSLKEAQDILKAGPPVGPNGRRNYTGVSTDEVYRIKNAMRYVAKHKR